MFTLPQSSGIFTLFEKSSYTYLSTQHKAYMGEMIKRMAHVWKERFCVCSSLDGSQLSLNLKYFDNDTLLLLLLLLMFINCLANHTFYPANEIFDIISNTRIDRILWKVKTNKKCWDFFHCVRLALYSRRLHFWIELKTWCGGERGKLCVYFFR